MKRKIITLLMTMAISTMVSATAMAADEAKLNGFYDIGTSQDVVITPLAGDTQVSVTEKNIDDDDALEKLYENSNKLDLTYSGATANEYYGIILVDGSGLPTKDTEIYYVDQETASSSDIAFKVGAKIPAETTDMTLYISSSAEGASLISIPMNYAVNATEVVPEPAYKAGDANGDGIIDVKDVITIRRHIAGGYTITIVEEAANVNGDAIIDVKDAITIRRFIAGGYGVEL